jgi:hypothetical protein
VSLRLIIAVALVVLMAVLWWRVRKVQRAARRGGHGVTVAEVLDLLLSVVQVGLALATIVVLISATSYWASQNAIEGERKIDTAQCRTTAAQVIAGRAFRDADVRSFELAVVNAVARVRLLERRQDRLGDAGLTPGGYAYVAQWIADDLALAREEVTTNRAELAERLQRRDEYEAQVLIPECPPDPDGEPGQPEG